MSDTRTVSILRRLDVLRQLRFVEIGRLLFLGTIRQSSNTVYANSVQSNSNGVNLTHIGTDVKVFRRVALRLPIYWPIAPLLYVPGAQRLCTVTSRFFVSGSTVRRTDHYPRIDMSPSRPALALLVDVTPRFVRFCGLSCTILYFSFLITWLVRSEFYPLSAWQMYSWKAGPIVTYYKIDGVTPDGGRQRFNPAKAIGALGDGRFMDHVPGIFTPRREMLVRNVILAALTRWNMVHAPQQRFVAIEVQEWRWDFVKDPNPSYYGGITKIARVESPSSH